MDLQVKYDYDQAKTIEKLIAQSLSLNPAAAAKASKASLAYMKRMEKAAMRVTAARTRKKILSIYVNNEYGWEKHQDYSNWFGSQGSVSIAGLVAANRPKKTTTAKGNRRKKGYSKTGVIKPPKNYPIGGRLAKSTRYKVTDDDMVVGVMKSQQDKVKKKMQQFQDGGKFNLYNSEQSRKYLAALGIYIRRSTSLQSKPRPLYEKLAREEPIAENFQKSFIEMLNDKLRVGK